jgi:hypothetical protein
MTRITIFSITALLTVLVTATAPVGAKSTPPLKGDVLGSFFFHDCPAGTQAGALCLHDDIVGTLTHLGRSTGSFEVVFDAAAFVDGCGPIRKKGSFTAANGDQLDVEAEGTFCFTTLVATYAFQVTGGTGRFAGSSGSGSWLVPPPTAFDGVAGVGDEILEGVLVK